jgi:hypothetical protein
MFLSRKAAETKCEQRFVADDHTVIGVRQIRAIALDAG